MSLRVIGPRVLLAPVETPASRSPIALTDKVVPTVGRVLGIGKVTCDCGADEPPAIAVGDLALVAPTEGQEVRVDGTKYWIVPYRAILGLWQTEEPL